MAAQGKNNARPIIIVKRKKKGVEGHHGGAWKVAYADFVTAMMAFFLVMWLVTAVSKEQRAAIYQYFKNPSMETGKSVKAAPGQMGPGGASTSPINLGGGLDAPRSGRMKTPDFGAPTRAQIQTPDAENKRQAQTDAEAQAQALEAEHKKLESLMEELHEAVSKSQALEPFKDQLLLDITPDGIRIQIVDAQNRPMFDVGSARLRDYTQSILHELAPYLSSVPNRISITGHTDTRPYPRQGYSNWELSADRANAARRALVTSGLPDEKIARVVGLASSVLFDRADPQSPINRRISIVIMTKQAEQDALKTDVVNVTPTAAPGTKAAPAAGRGATVATPGTAATPNTTAASGAAANPSAATTPSAAANSSSPATLSTATKPSTAATANTTTSPAPTAAPRPATSQKAAAAPDAIASAVAALQSKTR